MNTESIIEDFRNKAGGILCSELKEKKFMCVEYVRMADKLIEDRMK